MLFSLGLLLVSASTSLAECPPDTIYETYFNKCYKYYNSLLPFLGAEKQCNSIGGSLVAIQSNIENSYVSGIASGATGHTPNFWIGANQLVAASWSWTYNTSMSYTNWAPGQPGAGYPCGLIRDSDSKWISGACNTALPFVCSVDPNAPQPGYCPTEPPAPTCPSSSCPGDAICSPGYILYAENCMCYKYVETYLNYPDALASCVSDSATLVKIDTPQLNNFLTVLIENVGCESTSNRCPWIGLHCFNSSIGSCSWQDGSVPVYTNFWQGKPVAAYYSYVLVSYDDGPGCPGCWENANSIFSSLCQKPATTVSLLMATQNKEKEQASKNNRIQNAL